MSEENVEIVRAMFEQYARGVSRYHPPRVREVLRPVA
jgi:hypothetical protein